MAQLKRPNPFSRNRFLRALKACGWVLLVAGCAVGRGGSGTEVRHGVAQLLTASDAPPKLVCGHRGDFFGSFWVGGANTVASLEHARARGAELVEVDVRLTKDRVPVITHADWPRKHTLAEWRARGRRIVLLEDVLRWAAGRTVLVLDVKSFRMEPVVAAVRRLGAQDSVVLLAGDPTEYARMRAAGPELYKMVRAKRPADVDAWLRMQDRSIVMLHVDPDWLTPDLVHRAHAAGWRVFANSYRQVWHQELFGAGTSARRAFAAGVDVIQTNRPASAARARDAWVAAHE